MSTTVTPLHPAPPPDARVPVTGTRRRRLLVGAVAALAVVGGAVTVAGAFSSWVAVFGGLLPYRGTSGPNGVAVAVAGGLLVVLGLAYLLTAAPWVRTAVTVVATVALGATAVLLVHRHAALSGGDPMVDAVPGPGLPLAAGGAALAFLSALLPDPRGGGVAPTGADAADDAAAAAASGVRALGSWTTRVWAIAGLAVTAVVHIPVDRQHLGALPYLGWAAVAVVVACGVGVGLVVVAPNRGLWRALVVGPLLAAAAYLVSRSVGLPGDRGDLGAWGSQTGWVALGAELVTAGVAAGVLWESSQRDRARARTSCAAPPAG